MLTESPALLEFNGHPMAVNTFGLRVIALLQKRGGERIVKLHQRTVLCCLLNGPKPGYVIQHSLLGGVSDPDMMPDITPRFEPLCNCMVICFSGAVHYSHSHTQPVAVLSCLYF